MLSNTFDRLYNKVFTDSRDFPVSFTEEHTIEGAITDENRKIKLGEKVHSFQDLIVYKAFKSNSSLDIRIVEYDSLSIFYSQIDLTVDYVSYDSTHDVYNFKISLVRSDTLESQSNSYDITGNIGTNNILSFTTIWGNFSLLLENFILGAKVVICMIGYESSIMIIDTFNPFIGGGSSNHLFFNVPANAIYINELPIPQASGDISLLVKYMGLGSVITAESLNDIISIVKYYNLLPKFDVTKVNNNDIKLDIRGEYYYMGTYVEKIDSVEYQLENEILLGEWNALISFLDIPNRIFNIRRVAVGDTYNNLIADITNFIVENPESEIPIFVMIFDTNKNLFEYAYVSNSGMATSSPSGVNKYNVTFTGVLNVSFSLLSDTMPVITLYDENGDWFMPDSISVEGTLVEIVFLDSKSGTIAAVN